MCRHASGEGPFVVVVREGVGVVDEQVVSLREQTRDRRLAGTRRAAEAEHVGERRAQRVKRGNASQPG
jgi:hypothetical protein